MRRIFVGFAAVLGGVFWACTTSPESEGTKEYTGTVPASGYSTAIDTLITSPCSRGKLSETETRFTSSPDDSTVLSRFPSVCRDTTGATDSLFLIRKDIKFRRNASPCQAQYDETYSHYFLVQQHQFRADSGITTDTYNACGGTYTGTTREEWKTIPLRTIRIAAVLDTSLSSYRYHGVRTPALRISSYVYVYYKLPGETDWTPVIYYGVDVNARTCASSWPRRMQGPSTTRPRARVTASSSRIRELQGLNKGRSSGSFFNPSPAPSCAEGRSS